MVAFVRDNGPTAAFEFVAGAAVTQTVAGKC
jgi:hypothetical protein